MLGITDKDTKRMFEIQDSIIFMTEGDEFYYKGELHECISNGEYITAVNIDNEEVVELEHEKIIKDNHEDYQDEIVDEVVHS